MANRQQIVDSLAALARKLGRTPTRSQFISATGISEHYITLSFASWREAAKAAGLDPQPGNIPPEDLQLLSDWGEVTRKMHAAPSRRAYRREGKYDVRTLERRFGRWSLVPRAFLTFAKDKPEWADVLALLPSLQYTNLSNTPSKPSRERATYGNPLDFSGLRHEPVNEQGVVLLFGMLAQKLGYIVEAVRIGFPDCEAKRQIGPQRWEKVRIEFEFESRNFRDHGHPPDGCDLIVCWRHNWEDCPTHLEIVELSKVVHDQTARSG
jgi:hypothetical protein